MHHYTCLSICPSVTLFPPKLLGGIQPNLLHDFSPVVRVWYNKFIFHSASCDLWVGLKGHCILFVSLSVFHLLRCLLLNHWVEINQTCYMTSPHDKGMQEQHVFPMFAVCLSVIPLHVSTLVQSVGICDGVPSTAQSSFSYFFIRTYVVGTHKKRLVKVLLMSTHNICFHEELEKLSQNYHQILFLKKSSWHLHILIRAFVIW